MRADTVRILYTFKDTGLFTFIRLVCCRSLDLQVSVMQEKTNRKRSTAVQHNFVTSVLYLRSAPLDGVHACDELGTRENKG
jgi:hypothetical protein